MTQLEILVEKLALALNVPTPKDADKTAALASLLEILKTNPPLTSVQIFRLIRTDDCLEGFAGLDDEKILTPLLDMFRAKGVGVSFASEAFEKIGTDKVATRLIQEFERDFDTGTDEERRRREQLIQVIAKLNTFHPLIEMLKYHPKASFRADAAQALCLMGHPEAVIPILEYMNEEKFERILPYIGKLRDKRLLTPVIEQLIQHNLYYSDASLVFSSLLTLSELVDLLKHENAEIRVTAMRSLISLSDADKSYSRTRLSDANLRMIERGRMPDKMNGLEFIKAALLNIDFQAILPENPSSPQELLDIITPLIDIEHPSVSQWISAKTHRLVFENPSRATKAVFHCRSYAFAPILKRLATEENPADISELLSGLKILILDESADYVSEILPLLPNDLFKYRVIHRLASLRDERALSEFTKLSKNPILDSETANTCKWAIKPLVEQFSHQKIMPIISDFLLNCPLESKSTELISDLFQFLDKTGEKDFIIELSSGGHPLVQPLALSYLDGSKK